MAKQMVMRDPFWGAVIGRKELAGTAQEQVAVMTEALASVEGAKGLIKVLVASLDEATLLAVLKKAVDATTGTSIDEGAAS